MTANANYLHPLTSDVAGTGTPVDTAYAKKVRIDIHIEAFTGGTTPSITFLLESLGLDGRWYTAWTSGAVTATGDIPVDVGEFSGTYAAGAVTMAHAALGSQSRLRWTFGGGVAPTAVVFSASVYPRS